MTLQQKRILVVDDEKDLREVIAYDLEKQGFEVLMASNGKEAFEIVTQNEIHLVITDIRMPEEDGIQLLKKIRSLDPSKPVVMLISGFSDVPIEEAYHLGAAAVFAKPFDRKEFFDAIRWALTWPEK